MKKSNIFLIGAILNMILLCVWIIFVKKPVYEAIPFYMTILFFLLFGIISISESKK